MLSCLLILPVQVEAESAAAAAIAPLHWLLFNLLVLVLLALDLGVLRRRGGEMSLASALRFSGLWLAIGLAFNLLLYFWLGRQPALEFLTGFLVEKALAVDNIFVFAMIFAFFHVPREYQDKVLFWGILGALLMRAIFIFCGVALIERFSWTLWVFGALLIITGIKMVASHGKKLELDKSPAVRWVGRLMPLTAGFEGDKFTVLRDGRRWATPLLIVLVLIELSDLIFAIDSIPAILAITRDPFIVYTSNVLAVLGLRALYFALSGVIGMFHLLHYGLSAVLVFIGAKMCLAEIWHIPTLLSLAVVGLLIGAGIAASLLIKPQHGAKPHGSHADGTPAYDYPEDAG